MNWYVAILTKVKRDKEEVKLYVMFYEEESWGVFHTELSWDLKSCISFYLRALYYTTSHWSDHGQGTYTISSLINGIVC